MSEMVMNNPDLRGIIFSFFRKKPKIICSTCNKVCVWDKKIINNYIEIPTKDNSIIYNQCINCNRRASTRFFINYPIFLNQ